MANIENSLRKNKKKLNRTWHKTLENILDKITSTSAKNHVEFSTIMYRDCKYFYRRDDYLRIFFKYF